MVRYIPVETDKRIKKEFGISENYLEAILEYWRVSLYSNAPTIEEYEVLERYMKRNKHTYEFTKKVYNRYWEVFKELKDNKNRL